MPRPREVPIISLASTTGSTPDDSIVQAVASAAATYGFFQIVDHGIDRDLINDVWGQTRAFFSQPAEVKRSIGRTRENTRGYYDRELTKNKRDQKEVLDIAHVPFPDLAAEDPRNHHAIDGINQWPNLPGFEKTILAYLNACERAALHLLKAFCAGLGEEPTALHQHFGTDHTSFIRMNHYPTDDVLTPDEAASETALGDMALHHHSDAGALTLLLQDDVGGLQVKHEGEWLDVVPTPGALVVNTGDMMQVWSNDRYQAALHRVAPRTNQARYSLPYFFNPSYSTTYAPLPGSIDAGGHAAYRPINWGDFRQARADGDFADYGAEIQITDYRTSAA